MKDYAKMTRAELLRRIAALEKVAPGPRLAFANERLLHDLQVHQAELETHNRELREAQQLIELSRDRYADLFDFAPVGYVTLDDKGLIREINLTAAGLLGEERARLVGKPFRLHVARADLAEFRAHLRALTEPDQHTAAELQLIRKGRPALPVLMQSMLVADAEPGLRLYRTTLTDLTARKQAEEERQKFVSLADNSSDFIGMCDRDFIPFYANAAALRLAGLADLAAACRTKVQDYFFPEDQPFITNEFFPRVLRDGHGEVEIRFRHFQTGAAIWMLYNVFAIRAASGTPVGWATVSRDITERRRAEEQTRELQNFLSSIVENIPMMLFVKDATDLRFVRVNKEEEKRVGHTREEMIGRTDFDFFPREQAELFVRSDREALEKGALTDIPEEAVSTPQGLRIFHTKKIPICDAQGHPAYLLGISEDITGRRQVEELLRSRSLQQQAVAEFGQHALAGRDLARLFQDAVALVPLVLGVEFGKVLELRPESGDLLLRAGTGWKKGVVGRATVSSGLDSQAGCTLLADAPIVVDDYAQESRFPMPPLLTKHGIRSGVSVVIHTRGRPYGVLGAHGLAPRSFSGDDVHFVQSIAHILAAAIDRRDLEEELLKASDAERARIGQDLHDDLCQQLTGIELRTEVLKHRLADLPAAREEAERIGGYIRVAMLHARTLAYGLSPVQFEADGLMSALHELVAGIAELFSVACDFRCDSPVLIADQFAATHLYRIAQEAISNAIRHGHARHVVVSLTPSPEGGVLTVADDGSGCSTTIWESTGMGLRTMHYRSEMIGATLRLEPGAGGGTAVICEFQAP